MSEVILIIIYLGIGQLFAFAMAEDDKFWAKLFCITFWPLFALILVFIFISEFVKSITKGIKRIRDNDTDTYDDR